MKFLSIFYSLCLIWCMIFCPSIAEANFLSGEKQYAVTIEGDSPLKEQNELYGEFQNSIEAQVIPDDADASYLNYRFEQDQVMLKKMLEAEGYYQSAIKASWNETTHTATFHVDAGPQYHFGTIQLVIDDASNTNKIHIPTRDTLKVQSENPALAALVYEDIQSIEQSVEKENCLFEQSVTHQAVVNHLSKQVNITFRIHAGAEVTFGDVAFTGQESIDESYLKKRVPIQAGDCFRRSKLNDAKIALQKTGLLAQANAVLPETATSGQAVPITFSVLERAHRTVKAGASFSTDIGPGISAGWEHRNLFSEGEKFTADVLLATQERSLKTSLAKPYFLRDDQSLKIGGKIAQEDNDAYETTGASISAGVERDLGDKWTAGLGVQYGFERIRDQDGTENVALLSFPAFAAKDTRNDPLDPTSGWVLNLNTAPSIDTIDRSTRFLKNSISGSYYQGFEGTARPVLAVRGATGSILGASSDTIPATERFYAGGSGSIRGYGYQLAGPLDADNDPLGGRSFVEFSTELRLRILEDYGMVAFVDGGNVFDSTYANFENNLLWGAGIGFRYYTSFGPVRADIAVPLNKRAGVDDAFQLYFSIGQAF